MNLWFPDEGVAHGVGEIVDAGADFGAGSAAETERIQVEMVSANPTGPITVASARNGADGICCTSPRVRGHTVERENDDNDSGAETERFDASVDAVRRGEEAAGGRLSG